MFNFCIMFYQFLCVLYKKTLGEGKNLQYQNKVSITYVHENPQISVYYIDNMFYLKTIYIFVVYII